MNNYIKKNILIDELLDYELTYNTYLLDTFEELKNTTDFQHDINLLNNCINIIDDMIFETNEYLNSINLKGELEYEFFIVSNKLNDLYNAKYKIINYLNNLNESDILSELIGELEMN
jgi:hypothetical protein